MSTAFPITEQQRQSWFQRHDWQLFAIIAVTIALFLVLLVPLIGTLRFMNGFHEFIQDVTASARYGREHRTTTITLNGERQKANFDGVSSVIGSLTDAGMGRPNDVMPNGGIAIEFGDGSGLSLSEVSITTASRQNDEGVLVRYTRPDGSVYSYDTDRMTFEALCDMLHMPS